MTAAPQALWITLTALSLACAVYSGVVLWRVRRGRRAAPDIDAWADAPGPPGAWPTICVVVPAHNEAGVVARLARSLAEQDYPSFTVVYALDRCTDATRAEIGRVHGTDPRFEIVEIDACPDGWAGKTHAAHAGVTRSRAAADADLLLFTDADCWFHPRCLRAAAAALREKRVDMLSLLSTLDAEHAWERLLQPAAVMALLRQHPLDRVNSPRTRRAFANGQFMLFDAAAYRAIGGHEAVRGELLEDLALAYTCKHAGKSWAVHPAGAALRCRMYDALPDFRSGWRRIYTESARRSPARLRKWALEFTVTGALLPLGALAALALGAAALLAGAGDAALVAAAAGAAALAAWAAAVAVVWRAQGAPARHALLAPLASLEIARLMARAASDLARRRAVRWAGREYRLEPRPEPGSKKRRATPDPASPAGPPAPGRMPP